MTRKHVWMLALLLTAAVPVAASGDGTAIAGYVKNSSGTPQMGAVVQVYGPAAAPIATVSTDARGYYEAPLAAGVYYVKVTAPSFLPALREDVTLRTGAAMVVNFTLNTLYEAFQLTGVRKGKAEDEEEWKWTLRSMSNRPVLRVVEGSPVIVSRGEAGEDGVLTARVAFLAGSDGKGSGSSGGNTLFQIERSMFSTGSLSFSGNLGYNGDSAPATVLRAAYTQQFEGGGSPEFAFTMRRFQTPHTLAGTNVLQALTFSVSDTYTLMDFADVKLGAEYQTVDFLGRASALKPHASVDLRVAPETIVSYRYATTQPLSRIEKGFDTAPADLSESGPRMAMFAGTPRLERARHHEVAVARSLGKNKIEAAWFHDAILNPALTGVGDYSRGTGQLDILPDMYSGAFTYGGRDFSTHGLRVSAHRKVLNDLAASLSYAWAGVLELPELTPLVDARRMMAAERRHSVTTRLSGTAPGTKTRWAASYKWTSGDPLLPLDMFNEGATQSDPYLNVFLRQPLPDFGFLPSGFEALVDVRNLMAQGYVPVLGSDGQTVYLVESARSLRGGLAFKF